MCLMLGVLIGLLILQLVQNLSLISWEDDDEDED
jgi:hypothetical protein